MSTLASVCIYDIYSNLPSAGIPGRMFYVSSGTNAGKVYRDNGSTWDQVATGGGGGSPLTTKGDLYGFTTTDARIPIGTDGQVLTADSTATPGVSWQAAGGGSSTVNVRQAIQSPSASSVTLPLNVVAGNLIVVCVTGQSTLPTAITDSQLNTYTSIASELSSAYAYIAFAVAGSSGALTVTEAGGVQPAMFAIEIVPPSGFSGTVDGTATSNSSSVVTLTTTGTADLVFFGMGTFAAFNYPASLPPMVAPMYMDATAGGNGAMFGWYLASFAGLQSGGFTVFGSGAALAAGALK